MRQVRMLIFLGVLAASNVVMVGELVDLTHRYDGFQVQAAKDQQQAAEDQRNLAQANWDAAKQVGRVLGQCDVLEKDGLMDRIAGERQKCAEYNNKYGEEIGRKSPYLP